MSAVLKTNQDVLKQGETQVVIGVIATPSVHLQWMISVINSLKLPIAGIIIDTVKPIDRSRNIVIERFLADFPYGTHLLFWDSDIIVPDGAVSRLLSLNKDIASGLYVQKGAPFYPLINMRAAIQENTYQHVISWKENTVVDCDSAGLGFTLIRRNVLQNMERPWTLMTGTTQSEDYYFFSKAQALGYRCYVDTGLKLGHVGEYVYTIEDFRPFQRVLKGEQ